ncbi:hypothetical protein AJ79_03948 [Helicocarpus griseus UAMH5409]|uniref:Uncharacterized protein n=1 Tax=Helicocarpus griseus UAMH5409 TaxID=1447875 RepID=A0A2B7XVJ1_9EURO|nr:hypothetical protein AJ79_03948 [Helicocarpus griseus UAMH5409]
MSQAIMNRALFCRSCLNQSAGLGKAQTRFFSSSGACSRAWIPSFKPTSSQELDQLLSSFREHVFIPAFLTPAQRRLVYKENANPSLDQNPITITLKGQTEESYRLRHLNWRETPGNNVVRGIVGLMKQPDDWFTLVPLLKGLHTSKRTPNIRLWEFILSKAGEAGMNSVILDCATQAERTGLSLGDYFLAEQVFKNLHLKAESLGFQGPELEKLLRQAKSFAALLETEEHAPLKEDASLPESSKKPDPRRHPNIISVLLELNAARALDAFDGKDVQGAVRTYAEILLSNWELRHPGQKVAYPKHVVKEVRDLPSMSKGIELALEVDEIRANEELHRTLRKRLQELGTPKPVEAKA